MEEIYGQCRRCGRYFYTEEITGCESPRCPNKKEEMEFDLNRLLDGETPKTRGGYAVDWATYCPSTGLEKPILVVLANQSPKVLQFYADGRFNLEGKTAYDLVYDVD